MIQTPSLLITDDDRAFRETLEIVLEPLGLDTILASDGTEAVEIVQQREVHLILFDMHMPLMTGLEAVRQVRKMKSALPCVLMSARLDDSIRDEARQAEVDSVLAKPVTRKEVLAVVRQLLERTYHWPGPALR
jgi:CheY-like chemotaxis protein